MSEQFDPSDFAFLYFAFSVLIIILLPLTYSVIISPLLSFKTDPKYKKAPATATKAIELDKARNKFYKKTSYKWKLFFWIVIAMMFYNSYQQLPDPELMRGFDPYDVLQVSSTTPIDEIKRAYRQKAREMHPDKHPEEQEKYAEMFNKITKAYQCLTDPRKIPNCKKYGNPDGFTGYKVGIALPAVPKEQQGLLLIIIFFGFIAILLLTLWNVFKNVGKRDKHGILNENRKYLTERIIQNKHTNFENCLETISNCKEVQKKDFLGQIESEFAPGILYMCVDICLNQLKSLWREKNQSLVQTISRQVIVQIESIPKIIQYQSDIQIESQPKIETQLVGDEQFRNVDLFNIIVKLTGLKDHYISSKTFPVLKENCWNVLLMYKDSLIGFRQGTENKSDLQFAFSFVPYMFESRKITEYNLKVYAYADSYQFKLEKDVIVKCQWIDPKELEKDEEQEIEGSESANDGDQSSNNSEEEQEIKQVRPLKGKKPNRMQQNKNKSQKQKQD